MRQADEEQGKPAPPGGAMPAVPPLPESVATIATAPLQLDRQARPLPETVASAIDDAIAAAVQPPSAPPSASETLNRTDDPAPGPAVDAVPGGVSPAPAPTPAGGAISHDAGPTLSESPPRRPIPKYEWPRARPMATEAPPPPSAPQLRPPLGELAMPYLAAVLALGALGTAIYLDTQSRAREERIASDIAALRSAVDALAARSAQVQPFDFPTNDGTIDALMALQKRIAALEAGAGIPAQSASLPQPAPLAGGTEPAAGPAEDCIPAETRFVALPGEAYPICRTPEVITLANISADSVTTDRGLTIVEGGFERLGFGTCTLLVLSADVEGFAELRVTCS